MEYLTTAAKGQPRREPRRVELGSGPYGLSGFIHIDAVKKDGWNVDYIADVRKLDFIVSDAVDELYSAHTVEHFSYTEILAVLREWNRVLRPGGSLTVKMPDLDFICKAYVNHVENRVPKTHEASQHSPEEILVLLFGGFSEEMDGEPSSFEHTFGVSKWTRGCANKPVPNPGVYTPWGAHKALYNYEMFAARLALAGFRDTRRIVENDWELHVVTFK